MIRGWKRMGAMLIVLLAVLVSLLHFSPQASAVVVSPDGWGWKNPLPQGNRLSGVWGTSANNVYAVGDAGTILHYGGTTWDSMDSGTSNNLYGVWGSSAADIYAVGAGGIVLRYTGGNWTSVTAASHDLYGVWGNSSDVYAVGDAGTILHYNGSTWTSTITGSNLRGVWGSSSSDVFAVGDGGIILHYTTNTWSSITIPPNNLRGVWGSSSTDVYAVGDAGTILHYTTGAWSSVLSGTTNPLYAVWGTSPSDIYAAGDGGTIMHYNASTWSPMISNTSNNLKGLWGSSSDAFGVGEAGIILHYSGGTWNSRTVGMTNNLKAVWGSSSTDVFAVGDAGTIWHCNGTAWSTMTSGTTWDLRGIWGTSASNVYAVGASGTILHYDGSSWSSTTSGSANLNGVWGTSSSDIYAVGDTGTILHYDGNSWTPTTTSNTKALYGVWSSSSSDVFAVGASGTIMKYNGSEWNVMGGGPTEDLYGVWGTSSTNVFAVGNGTILRYNGSWSSMSGASGRYLRNIWGTGSSDTYAAYAVGLGGVILQYTSGAWKPMNSGTAYELSGAWGSSSSDVFAVGRNGTILHYRDLPSPTLNQVTPPQGIQGQSPLDVTINGAYLDGTTAANFGQGITVNTPTVSPSGTQVTAQISIASDAVLGPRDISVTTNLGTATMKAAFTVLPPPPAIASFTPIQGVQGQQLDITIIGTNLGGATAASFGQGITVSTPTASPSGTQVTARITIDSNAPLGARDVSITTMGGPSSPLIGAFTVLQLPQPPPTVTDVSPKEAAPAQSLDLTILGTNLGNTTAVVFGNGITVNRIGLNSGTQITANVTIAADATPGARDVTVYAPGGTFTLLSGFTVSQLPSNEPTLMPVILSVSPNQGIQGETLSVTITGANLSRVSALAFGDGIIVNSIGISSATEITANITITDGATPGARTVSLTNTPGGKLGNGFTVIDSSQASSQTDGRAKGSESGGHGVQAWVWVLVALAVLVFAGSVVFIIRLRREIAE